MVNKSNDPKIEKFIVEMFENTPGNQTISGAQLFLKDEYNLNVSPQVVKSHIQNLINKGVIKEI